MPSSSNSFEVPADRPHLRIWPKRLPLFADGARDLALVQRRGGGDALPGQGGVRLLRPQHQLRRAALPGRGAGRLAAAGRRRQGRPRRPLHAELPAVPDRALRHLARQRGGGAGESDEPGRGVQPLHRRPRYLGHRLHRRPGAHRRRRPGGAARGEARAPGAGHPLHRHHARRPDRRGRRAVAGDGGLAADRRRAAARLRPLERRARRQLRSRPAHRRAPTTWRCCPTPRARPACPRAACTPIAP